MDRYKLLALDALVGLASLVVIAAVGLFGPEPKDAYAQLRTPHAALISGFESYISAAEARRRLPRQLPVRVLFESKTAADDPRPRFDELTLRVSGFDHVGFVGDLDLDFVNDRLMSTRFCPAEYDPYLSALQATGVRFENYEDNPNLPHPGRLTHIWATRAAADGPKDRSCVDWVDGRLLSEVATWRWRYVL